MRGAVVVATILGAACSRATEPDIPTLVRVFDVGGGAVKVKATTDENLADAYAIQFAGGDDSQAIHLPDKLDVRNIERLASDNSDCDVESLVGVAVAPAVRVNAEMTARVSSHLQRVMEGPIVATFEVTYSAGFDCDGSRTLTGTSTFTMFPDRVVRNDEVTPDMATIQPPEPSDPPACGCKDPSGQLFFTTFWTLDNPMTVSDENGNPVSDETVVPNHQFGCNDYGDTAIGVAWSNASARLRAHGMDSGAHTYDWVHSLPTISASKQVVTSAVQIANDCAGARDALDLMKAPAININKTETVPLDIHGVYVDDATERTDTLTITSPSRVPGGFAIATNVGHHAKVSATAHLQHWFEGDKTLFYFPDALEVGSSITIEPK